MPDLADGAWGVPADDEAALRHRISDLPDVRHVADTPLGHPILTFTAAGQDAVNWSARLRLLHPQTGRWPLLMDPHVPLYSLSDGSSDNTWHVVDNRVDMLGEAEDMDGAAAFAEQAGQDLLDRYAAAIAADRRGDLTWPEHPRRHEQFELPFNYPEMAVHLIPATAGWQVPAVVHYGSWGELPDVATHAAMLRHWHRRFGVEIVAIDTNSEFAVTRPPETRADALEFAWQYLAYNDGSYDLYHTNSVIDLAASLLHAPVMLAWWD